MNQKRAYGSRVIAALLLLAIVQISLQVGLAEPNTTTNATAVPQQVVGRLKTKNNQPVMVNGLSASTGASILTGATIETGADQTATVDLGALGSLDIAPNTKVTLTYDDQRNVRALVLAGCVTLNAKKNTTGEVANEQGSIGKTDPANGGIVNTCNQAPAPPPQTGEASPGLFGMNLPTTIAVFAGIGAAALTPLWFQSNPSRSTP